MMGLSLMTFAFNSFLIYDDERDFIVILSQQPSLLFGILY